MRNSKFLFQKLRMKLFFTKRKFQTCLGKINILRAYYWGVKIGKNSTFRGHCYFKKAVDSSIIIGNNFHAVSVVNESNIIKRPCTIQTNLPGAVINIGNNVGVSGCVIACFKKIQIGNDVRIGGNCTIFDADFHLDDPRVGNPKEVIIEDNVWLGYNVIVMKGVRIGANTIIGAGSVVTRDVPPNCIAAGCPCKVIKKIVL